MLQSFPWRRSPALIATRPCRLSRARRSSTAWRSAAAERAKAYAQWTQRFEASPKRDAFIARLGSDLGAAWVEALAKFKQQAVSLGKEATRVSSQNVLEALTPHLPQLLGGSADLTGSNNTKTKAMQPVNAENYDGRYIYYGVREHAMAAAMNGLALHGDFIPYGGTFLVFTDYCRPAIRLSALMQQRVIYVMTHDSIGLGEDGPTHQPVEHLASLRAIPNLNVFRPADTTETAECWQLAIGNPKTPSILALTRQALPQLRTEYVAENLCAKGAYVLREAKNGAPKVVIMATGSEVMLAVEAQAKLEAKGIATRVVSVPCMELFFAQPASYRQSVLGGPEVKRIAIEAAIEQGWEKLLSDRGIFIGMKSFGASAPAEELYKRFGITTDAIVGAASVK